MQCNINNKRNSTQEGGRGVDLHAADLHAADGGPGCNNNSAGRRHHSLKESTQLLLWMRIIQYTARQRVTRILLKSCCS
jgi:hypothetical protein